MRSRLLASPRPADSFPAEPVSGSPLEKVSASSTRVASRSYRVEQRFVTLGVDALGHVLVVIHAQREERTHLISARKASRGVADRYHA